MADEIARLRTDPTAWITASDTGPWSLAGAQAKVALLDDGGRRGKPHGRLATNRILKPAISGLDNHDLNEHLCLTIATALGLRAAPS